MLVALQSEPAHWDVRAARDLGEQPRGAGMLRRRLCASLIALLFTVLLTQGPIGSAVADGCPAATDVPGDEATRVRGARAMLCLVNSTRIAHGLRAVRPSRQLKAVARAHSADMVARDYFAHDGPGGETFASRVSSSAYAATHPGYDVEEALAWGAPVSPAVLLRALMGSDTHRAILLDPSVREVGVGLVLGAPEAGVDGPSMTLSLDFGH